MTVIAGRTVLITGGASGIGLLTGRLMLQRGARRLVIWDRDEAALARAVAALGGAGEVAGTALDITDAPAREAAVAALGPAGADILVNNAGVIVGKPFLDHTPAEIERTMAVNATAPMHLARALLPGMVGRGAGHIVNIASAAGLVANPGMSAYCASKWAMTGWSDSLRLEMERAATGVRVTTVLPYYIDTGMFAGVRSPVLPILRPGPVARRIVSAVERDAIFLRMPGLLNLLPLIRGVMPVRVFDRVAGDWFGIYRSMDAFRGRGG